MQLENVVGPACSNAAYGDSLVSSETDPNLYLQRQAGESSVGDYQDSGAPSMHLVEEPPQCHPPSTDSLFCPARRNSAVLRYKEKRKTRR